MIKLSCPILLAPGENANIATTFKNVQAQNASILVKAVVGENNLESYRVIETTLTLSPGSNMEFSWQVDQKDIIYGNYILARVFLLNQDSYNTLPCPHRILWDLCAGFIWATGWYTRGRVVHSGHSRFNFGLCFHFI